MTKTNTKAEASSKLSKRERLFIKILVSGGYRRDIALEMGLSSSSVGIIQRKILAKLEAKTVLQAITILFRAGLLP